MGFSSGVVIFDSVCDVVLNQEVLDKKQIIKTLSKVLFEQDWDTETDSKYLNHPLIKEIFLELYPDYFSGIYECD